MSDYPKGLGRVMRGRWEELFVRLIPYLIHNYTANHRAINRRRPLFRVRPRRKSISMQVNCHFALYLPLCKAPHEVTMADPTSIQETGQVSGFGLLHDQEPRH